MSEEINGMGHEAWAEQIDAYLDGELDTIELQKLEEHLRVCPACTSDVVHKLQWKRTVHSAGQKFVPDPGFRLRIEKSISSKPVWWQMRPSFAALAAVLMLFGGIRIVQQEIVHPRGLVASNNLVENNQLQQRDIVGEIADLHVATLASVNPVDVVSSDRHNVKPWFAGKIPFTFDLPELQGTGLELIGGKVSYLEQSPGAQLLFRIRKHQVSVFIFQAKIVAPDFAAAPETDARSFHLETWRRNGLQYFVIGDVASEDIDALSKLLKKS